MLMSPIRPGSPSATHGRRRPSWLLRLGVAFIIAVPTAAAMTPAPEPVLRLASSLEPPSARAPVGETERALLRLESRAGQYRADEKVLIEDMMARLERMGQTIAELGPLITAMPGGPCPAAVPPTCPTQARAPTTPPGGPDTDLYWLILAGGAVLLALLALLWQRGRRETSEAGTGETPFWHSDPATAPVPASTTVAPLGKGTREVSLKPPSPPRSSAAGAPTVQPPVAPAASSTDSHPSAHEGDQSLELAEVMLSMRLTGSAAQTLEDHIRAHPRQALIHWLKLLDIYRRSGQQKDFEASAQQLQQHFNIAPPDWQNDHEPVPARSPSLENYVHISSRIQELWPRRSCAEYLGRLLEDNRGGTRTGFPQNVVEEILLLLTMLRG